jgi:hypothetical protein
LEVQVDEIERHPVARGSLMVQCRRRPEGDYRLALSFVLDRDERAGTWLTDELDIDQLDSLIERLVQGRDHLRRHIAGTARGSSATVAYMTPDSTPEEFEHEEPVRFVWTR